MTENELSKIVIGYAIEIHSTLGSGLLEKAYQECLVYQLQKDGFKVEKEKPISIIYNEFKITNAYRLDLLIENKLVIELKSIERHFMKITSLNSTHT